MACLNHIFYLKGLRYDLSSKMLNSGFQILMFRMININILNPLLKVKSQILS